MTYRKIATVVAAYVLAGSTLQEQKPAAAPEQKN
jgi:hypothetical protein